MGSQWKLPGATLLLLAGAGEVCAQTSQPAPNGPKEARAQYYPTTWRTSPAVAPTRILPSEQAAVRLPGKSVATFLKNDAASAVATTPKATPASLPGSILPLPATLEPETPPEPRATLIPPPSDKPEPPAPIVQAPAPEQQPEPKVLLISASAAMKAPIVQAPAPVQQPEPKVIHLPPGAPIETVVPEPTPEQQSEPKVLFIPANAPSAKAAIVPAPPPEVQPEPKVLLIPAPPAESPPYLKVTSIPARLPYTILRHLTQPSE